MKIYTTKSSKISGTSYQEVHKKAFSMYMQIKKRSKRRPYLRSAFFNKEKVFLSIFWQHLWEKDKWQDRFRRLKFYAAALELIQNSKLTPQSKENPNKPDEILHRFMGATKGNELFYVQIKEDKRSRRKDFISVFPGR